MDNRNPQSLPEPNPITRDRHRRQMLWQVYVPVFLAIVIIVILAVLVAFATSNPQLTRFSDVSLIFLIIPTVAVGLVFLTLFLALVYLNARVIKLLPPYARLAQLYLDRLTGMLKRAADVAANPVLSVESRWAGIKTIFTRPGMNGSAGSGQTRNIG